MLSLLLYISIAVLILISIFLLSKATISIDYYHNQDKHEASIKIVMWKGLIKFSKEVQLPDDMDKHPSYDSESEQKRLSEPESLSMDDIQAAFQNFKDMLSQIRSYHNAVKKVTSKIKITDLQIKMHYGTGEASSTAFATGTLWSVTGGLVGIISHYFLLMMQPKIDIIPYFSVRKPLETKIECIANLRIAKTILAGLKMARSLRKATMQMHK